jgi:hypothetical protein
LTRGANPFVEELLNLGSISDDLHAQVLNGLQALVNQIRGL